MYVLDTNVVSELRKVTAGNSDANVAAWARTVATSRLHISVITILELETSALLLERRDPSQAAVLRAWLDGDVLPAFHQRLLPVDETVAQRFAGLHVPNRRQAHDALIAATALVHGLTVVTRNIADFVGTGAALLDPWQVGA